METLPAIRANCGSEVVFKKYGDPSDIRGSHNLFNPLQLRLLCGRFVGQTADDNPIDAHFAERPGGISDGHIPGQ